jgi:putative OPT family oligopeptide transporter
MAYNEITPKAIILGIIFGCFMVACFTYAGMVLGFTIGGSVVAAIVGWGILRGILKKCTIVENNINQTVASAINIATAGMIFTIPALYLMGISFSFWLVAIVCALGAVLGAIFIIPLRRQMIECERLRFPTGTAVATVLKTPGAGVKKARLLLYGSILSAGAYLLTQLYLFGLPSIPELVNISAILNLPPWFCFAIAISLMCFGMGYITGKYGLVVLAGGLLAYWIITPLVVSMGWLPSGIETQAIAGYVHDEMTRPLGIGMLIGGAIAGIAWAFPAIKAGFKGIKAIKLEGAKGIGATKKEEMPNKILYVGMVLAFIILLIVSSFFVGIGTGLAVAALGTIFMWLAGVIIGECTGMTDWSPISGLALVAIMVILFLTSYNVMVAVLIGAMICVAIGLCADMMQDLKTGHLCGAKPIKQQIVEIATCWIGPIVCLLVIGLLWQAYGFGGFGPGGIGTSEKIPAPQAVAAKATIEAIIGGEAPIDKYILGGVLGAALSSSGIPGLGVLVGISMYLPLYYILMYGVGCIGCILVEKRKGKKWSEENGVPFAAGLIAGECFVVLILAILTVAGVIG